MSGLFIWQIKEEERRQVCIRILGLVVDLLGLLMLSIDKLGLAGIQKVI